MAEPELTDTQRLRLARQAQRDLVYQYCVALHKRNVAKRLLDAACASATKAEQAMQAAWRDCKDAPAGVYSFEDFGDLCIVVEPDHDYPEFKEVR